jgi:hypothetical protein
VSADLEALQEELAEAEAEIERLRTPDTHTIGEAQRVLWCALQGDWPGRDPGAGLYDCPHELHGPLATYGDTYACSQIIAQDQPPLDVVLQAVTELVNIIRAMQEDREKWEEAREDARAEAHEDGREIGYAEGFRGGRSQGIREGREAVRREQVSVFGRSTTFAPHQPDPWDQDQDPAERDAIEHEPVSRWTLLRRPWPAAKTETAT